MVPFEKKVTGHRLIVMFARSLRRNLALLFLALSFACSFAASEKTASFAELAEKRYLAAGLRLQTEPKNVEAEWQFARACFDWAEFAANDDQREQIANEGIAAARQLVEQKPRLAQGHYYLAMNLGQLARTKTFGALRLVSEMEKEFKMVVDLDPKFDFAGADRNLGMLYHEAPGWPTSIGSSKKARQHLEHARELAPEFPENHLYLLEAYLKWGDKKAAQKEFESIQKLWPEMKKKLADEQWQRDWLDWEKRWKRLQDRFTN
ncbi:MAG: hypothetical protein JWM68_2775 [Verrucomicrobiales bacterium]|nr:hypothetical protein [Verrucomicrobiales bacterium]